MVQEKYQAGTAEYFEGELNRLRRSELGEKEKKAIEEFLTDFQYNSKEPPSFHRLYFHCNNLRTFGAGMRDRFLEPSSKDIIQGLKIQKDRGLSEWTIEGYKSSIKKFYKYLGKNEVVQIEALKYRNTRKINYKRKSDFNIPYEQLDLLIQACDNARDRAIISLLFDTGIRIGELITLKIKDVEITEAGLNAHVSGKTGERFVLAVGDSLGFVKEWRNVHPDQFNPEAWLFCGLGHNVRSKGESVMLQPMNHSEIYAVFKRVKKRAVKFGFPENIRIYPHKFRHAYATRMVSKIQQPILEKIMGWEQGQSRMTSVYIHLSKDDISTAIYEANGLKPPEKREFRKPKLCLKCKTFNPVNNNYCMHCGTALDAEEFAIQAQNREKISQAISDLIPKSQKSLLENLPEDSKLDVLATLLLEFEASGKLDEIRQRIIK